MHRTGKAIKTKNRLVVPYGQRFGDVGRSDSLKGTFRISFFSLWGDKSVLKLIVVIVVQLWEYTKNHETVWFKWIDYIVCELYLNKTVKRKTKNQIYLVYKLNKDSQSYKIHPIILQKSRRKRKVHWRFCYISIYWCSMS